MDAVSRRLMKELKDYQTTGADGIVALAPASDHDLLIWKATIQGQADSPYEGGIFHLLIEIPKLYPIQPPKVQFLTTVCHPNVHLKTGEICLDLLKSAWSPAWTLSSACVAIRVLLLHPEPDSPLNCDAANLLRCSDERGYLSLVRMYTQFRVFASEIDNTEPHFLDRSTTLKRNVQLYLSASRTTIIRQKFQ
ncbi:hypothetical protein SeMB42_g07832 [Synchytrium endobioticum]|uniref:UBC core domain-containing protein n=1 Tax=Synchytrium endobioticum TaxID=286115 RepID=A0A507C0C0_9FUNG|nr:hypothetical protein SeMB42_g07832 [Synchytrium endobioticum]TPX43897.1 hypothetical protein SeLEV6574_g04821 [Synchytrium endobioticum]